MADTTSSSSAHTRSSIFDQRPQDETCDSTDNQHTLNKVFHRSSDDDPLDSLAQFSESSTSYANDEPEDHYHSTSNSSYIQFEVQDDQLHKCTVGSTAQQCTNDYLYIQMELCEQRTLKHWLEENIDRPKQTVLKYFLDIVNAVEHVHDKRKIHRDLKVWLQHMRFICFNDN